MTKIPNQQMENSNHPTVISLFSNKVWNIQKHLHPELIQSRDVLLVVVFDTNETEFHCKVNPKDVQFIPK